MTKKVKDKVFSWCAKCHRWTTTHTTNTHTGKRSGASANNGNGTMANHLSMIHDPSVWLAASNPIFGSHAKNSRLSRALPRTPAPPPRASTLARVGSRARARTQGPVYRPRSHATACAHGPVPSSPRVSRHAPVPTTPCYHPCQCHTTTFIQPQDPFHHLDPPLCPSFHPSNLPSSILPTPYHPRCVCCSSFGTPSLRSSLLDYCRLYCRNLPQQFETHCCLPSDLLSTILLANSTLHYLLHHA
jgi:hypothetical protein